MRVLCLTLLLAVATSVTAQAPRVAPPTAPQVWQMQDSGTTASLRGIDSVDGTVAWASGTGGTVLKTTDGGQHWQPCAIPDGDKDGATLDFRGIQAWDAQTAIVMASGPGDKSRLYKTTDGCRTWRLVFKNHDKDGFWDAVYFHDGDGWLLGDPVRGSLRLHRSFDNGKNWYRQFNKGLRVEQGNVGAFAASNSSMVEEEGFVVFGGGGKGGAFLVLGAEGVICLDACSPEDDDPEGRQSSWRKQTVAIGSGTDSSGVFAIGMRRNPIYAYEGTESSYRIPRGVVVAVGGDYGKPDLPANTVTRYHSSGEEHWITSTTPPHGYRSTVQYSESEKLWITAGTNGSDISRDDGRTWQPLDDGNWNALSLPFIVGPKGRIARLNPAAIPEP